ncbi:diguanylate cyclase [Endothiovibrio diazotrophicus]
MTHVLVVEDNHALANMAKALIESTWGFEVHVAHSRAEAKLIVGDNPQRFTAALLDLNLPDAPNGEVVPLLQATGIPIVVLTGFYGDELRKRMTALGVVDYVVKNDLSAYQYACGLVGRIHRNRSIKVLAVDDSPSALAVIQHQLEVQCLKVYTAADDRQALSLFHAHPDIRLIITDYHMPEMDGFELTQKLRATHSKDQLAIIGLSSSSDNRLSARFLKSGANDFMIKPFGYEELLCRVNQNLEIFERIEEIRDAANRDYLTKLHNRRYFFNHGMCRYEQAKELDTPLNLAMIDIDFFKKVNDSQGHDGGDAALRHMAGLLNDAFPDELVARFGGEEFCVLMEGLPEMAATRLEAFRRTVESTPVNYDDHRFPFTVSIGLAHELEDNLDAMLKRADANLYRAKEEGRNRVIGSTPVEAFERPV